MTATVTELREVVADAAARFAERESAARTHEQRVELTRDVLRWFAEAFADRGTVASSMGDVVLVHLVGTTTSDADVFFLDTGYHFAETLGTRDAYAAMLPVRIRTILPRLTVPQQDAVHGPRLHDRDPDACCAMRKVEPLNRALEGYDAWASGMRRADTAGRSGIDVVGWDERRGLVKVNPIAFWTDADVERYVAEHGVFQNPLTESGYTSIGCAPCTRPVAEGEDARAGRWSGRAKVECGLHT